MLSFLIILFPGFEDFIVRFLQRLRQHTRPANHRDEVGIAHPTWDDVPVQVLFDARTTGVAQVETDIEALGAIEPDQNPDSFLDQEHHLRKLFGGQTLKSVGVLVWHDHDMPTGVRIKVEDNKVIFTPMDDQVVKVVRF